MIEFKDVAKAYPDGTVAVQSFNLQVDHGELIVLIGPSGCGKTTTLKMVNRLHEPTSGTICVSGTDIMEEDPVKLRRNIGYVIQQIGLFPHMTVSENISIVPELKKWDKAKRRQRADELLELVQMPPDQYGDRYPAQLSGGQQQRIGVLRALAADPEIILMDEPFGALDPITRAQLQDELKRLQEKLRKTILFVTHDMDEALKLADRIVIMREGHILQIGSPEEILRRPANQFVSEFIGNVSHLRTPESVTVREVMNSEFAAIEPQRGLAEALRLMKKRKVDHLIVSNGERRLLGVVSALDLHPFLSQDVQIPVREVMRTGGFATVSEEEQGRAAIEAMAANRMPFVAVVDSDGKIKGIVTRANLVDVLAENVWGQSDVGETETEVREPEGMIS